MWVCVILLHFQMDGAMSLVTALSLSLAQPVAMAATQRPTPPCQYIESDRPIRRGHTDTHCDYCSDTDRGATALQKKINVMSLQYFLSNVFKAR